MVLTPPCSPRITVGTVRPGESEFDDGEDEFEFLLLSLFDLACGSIGGSGSGCSCVPPLLVVNTLFGNWLGNTVPLPPLLVITSPGGGGSRVAGPEHGGRDDDVTACSSLAVLSVLCAKACCCC